MYLDSNVFRVKIVQTMHIHTHTHTYKNTDTLGTYILVTNL